IGAVGAAAFCFAELASSPMRTRRNLVHRAANYGRVRTATGKEMPRLRERALAPFIAQAGRLMLRVNPRTSVESVSAKLMAAGMRKTSPMTIIASKGIMGIGGFVFGLILGGAAVPKQAIFWALGMGLLGFMAPSVYLNGR